MGTTGRQKKSTGTNWQSLKQFLETGMVQLLYFRARKCSSGEALNCSNSRALECLSAWQLERLILTHATSEALQALEVIVSTVNIHQSRARTHDIGLDKVNKMLYLIAILITTTSRHRLNVV